MASECQRSVLACARCRRRKMKCDRNLPSCSQCTNARTKCTGFSNQVSAEVPRSIVRHLEFEIARLETELARDGHLDAVNASDILLQMPGHALRRTSANGLPESAGAADATPSKETDELSMSIMKGNALQNMISATLPHGSGLTDFVSRVRMGLTPSSARGVASGSETRRSTANPRYGGSNAPLEAKVLDSIPHDIVERLVSKYIHRVLPNNPFLDENMIRHHYDTVSSSLGWVKGTQGSQTTPLIAPSHDFLVVYLILAISVTLGSATGGHESRCMALSASLFEEGIQHLYSQASLPSELAGVQTILLLLLYGTVLPRAANVWILSGAAMRSCLELGLHREAPDMLGLDRSDVELRRKVFWAAYCMDRSICSALQRPLSIPDAAIKTMFPSAGDSQAFASHLPFIGSIRYHQLLSEMIHVHFQGDPLPAQMSWDDWLGHMEQNLRTWYETYGGDPTSQELMEFTLARALTILHRPSPRTPVPSQRSLLIAFEAASTSARAHREHILSGYFRRRWLSAHHTLEGAMIVLFCLRHGSASICQKFDASAIFDMTKLFTANFLSIASQGWPEVANYASVYERLLGPLLEPVFSREKDPAITFGPAQDAELVKLLYPGPAHLEMLRFGNRQQESFSPFDFNLFNADDEVLGSQIMTTTNFQHGEGLMGLDWLDHALETDVDFGIAF